MEALTTPGTRVRNKHTRGTGTVLGSPASLTPAGHPRAKEWAAHEAINGPCATVQFDSGLTVTVSVKHLEPLLPEAPVSNPKTQSSEPTQLFDDTPDQRRLGLVERRVDNLGRAQLGTTRRVAASEEGLLELVKEFRAFRTASIVGAVLGAIASLAAAAAVLWSSQ